MENVGLYMVGILALILILIIVKDFVIKPIRLARQLSRSFPKIGKYVWTNNGGSFIFDAKDDDDAYEKIIQYRIDEFKQTRDEAVRWFKKDDNIEPIYELRFVEQFKKPEERPVQIVDNTPKPPHPALKFGIPFGSTSISGWQWLWDGYKFYEHNGRMKGAEFPPRWIERDPQNLDVDKVLTASEGTLLTWLAELKEQAVRDLSVKKD